MKKLLLIPLILLILLIIYIYPTKEKEVKNPHGTSLTYLYLKDSNTNKYTLKLENIVISRSNDKMYYKNSEQKIIQKNGNKYVISNGTITKIPIVSMTDYTKGYLPENDIKDTSYKTGKEFIGIIKYTYEKYDYSDGETTYYFLNKKLKFIKNKTNKDEIRLKFISLSNKVDNKQFKLPKNYTVITY